jgi:uncharacterized membrane protein
MDNTQARNKPPVKESHARSILKAITWRLIATAATFLIAYFVFLFRAKQAIDDDLLDETARMLARKEARLHAKDAMYAAGSIAFFDLFIKLFLYYLHERLWQSINFGWIKRYNRKRKIAKLRKQRLSSMDSSDNP